MRTLTTAIILFTSSLLFGQKDSSEKTTSISKEEARSIAKREGYFLKSSILESNKWLITYSKLVGFTSGGRTPVFTNRTTTTDARTGKIRKKSRFNSLGIDEFVNDRVRPMEFEKRRKMKVWGEWVTVYYN